MGVVADHLRTPCFEAAEAFIGVSEGDRAKVSAVLGEVNTLCLAATTQVRSLDQSLSKNEPALAQALRAAISASIC
jgi:hypothetical protein